MDISASMSSTTALMDFIHVWALAIADFFRDFGINFPPASWGLS